MESEGCILAKAQKESGVAAAEPNKEQGVKNNEATLPSKVEIDLQIEEMSGNYSVLVNQIELLKNELATIIDSYRTAEEDLGSFKLAGESIDASINHPSKVDKLRRMTGSLFGEVPIVDRQSFLSKKPSSNESVSYRDSRNKLRDSILEIRATKTNISHLMGERMSFRGGIIDREEISQRNQTIEKIKNRISALEERARSLNLSIAEKRENSLNALKRESPEEWERIEKMKGRELGISYGESLQELSPKDQERLGIKRIRIKTVLEGPADLYQEPNKYLDIYSFLTEGLYPSLKSWNHVLGGDGGWLSDKSDRFNAEGRYEQEILPVEHILSGGGMSSEACYFDDSESGPQYTRRPQTEEDVRATNLVYPMCMGTGKEIWRDNHNAPFFLFTGKNEFFAHYVNSIQTIPEIREMLAMSNWHLNTEVILSDAANGSKTIKLKEPDSKRSYENGYVEKRLAFLQQQADKDSDFKKASLTELANLADSSGNLRLALDAYEKLIELGDDGNYRRRYAAVMAYLLGDVSKAKRYLSEHLKIENRYDHLDNYESEWENYLKNQLKIRDKILTRDRADYVYRHDIAPLNFLIDGIEVIETTPIKFPVVRHPKLKPLRWCHSSAAIMRDAQNRVQVMFFET